MQVPGLTKDGGVLSSLLQNTSKAAEKQPGESGGDSADISRAGRGMAEFSSSMWSPNDNTGFTMSAYTSHGTSVKLESHTQRFTLGKFAKTDSPFQTHKSGTGLDMDITFTSANGKTQTYKVTENMRFVESEDGEIALDDGRMPPKVHPDDKDMNVIAVNLNDNATTRGGTGDDILFNLGRGATLDGGDGDDTLISMGDKAQVLGGAGNDTLKVVRDVLRKEDVGRGSDIRSSTLNLHKAAVRGFEEGLSVLMDGGDGDDTLESDVKLHDSTIRGGDGNDILRFDKLVDSKLDAGKGDDIISVQSISGTVLNGGGGDDRIDVTTVSHNSVVDGGDGNDDISVFKAEGSAIRGGRGDDNIRVDRAEASVIDGGDGNDDIYVGQANGSLISGGRGDDTLFVKSGNSNLVDGGEGDNSITARCSALITDKGRILSNSIAPEDMASTIATLDEVISNLSMDDESRQRYRAILSYAAQALRTEESSASSEAGMSGQTHGAQRRQMIKTERA